MIIETVTTYDESGHGCQVFLGENAGEKTVLTWLQKRWNTGVLGEIPTDIRKAHQVHQDVEIENFCYWERHLIDSDHGTAAIDWVDCEKQARERLKDVGKSWLDLSGEQRVALMRVINLE